MFRRLSLLLVALAISVGGVTTATSHAAGAATSAAGTAPFTTQGSVEQVAVTHAPEGAVAKLLTSSGKTVTTGQDRRRRAPCCSAMCHPARGTWCGSAPTGPTASPSPRPLTHRHLPSTPRRRINDGYGYLKTRDGTTLSINVKLPGPADARPVPHRRRVLGVRPVEPRRPRAGVDHRAGARLRDRRRQPARHRVLGRRLAYFETLQSLDGYDVIEAVAAQPWVANGKVGMVGISYPGITQLFVAQTRPPHLAAITPLSVIDDTHETLLPGGILNDGFAFGWAEDRSTTPRPRGQGWVQTRIADGDKLCEENQVLRLQTPDMRRRDRAQPVLRSRRTARRGRAATFVDKIDVPVFLAGAWQDEQTGAHFANMLDDFAPGVPVKFTLMNGVHSDSFGPAVVARWAEFLDFYVAQRVPSDPRRHPHPRRQPARAVLRRRREAARRPVHGLHGLRRRARVVSAGAPRARARRRGHRRFARNARAGIRARVRVVAAAGDAGHHVVLRRRRPARRHRAHHRERRRRRQVQLRPGALPRTVATKEGGSNVIRRSSARRCSTGSRCRRRRRSAASALPCPRPR